MVAVVTVEDLPQMWQKPSYDHLVAIMTSLELGPAAWSSHRGRDRRGGTRDTREQSSLAAQQRSAETRYVASVIKSPLAWLATDDQREDIWAAAGRRMSERCGRMAVGDIVRRWPFPAPAAETIATALRCESFELVIREPALTGTACLGLKTWASAYVLAQQLPRLAASSLFRLFDESLGQPPPAVLELGSGTGLLGLAAAALWKASVTLSDLPAIVPNLQYNVLANKDVVAAVGGGDLRIGCLAWGDEEDAAQSDQELFGEPYQFPVSIVIESAAGGRKGSCACVCV